MGILDLTESEQKEVLLALAIIEKVMRRKEDIIFTSTLGTNKDKSIMKVEIRLHENKQ